MRARCNPKIADFIKFDSLLKIPEQKEGGQKELFDEEKNPGFKIVHESQTMKMPMVILFLALYWLFVGEHTGKKNEKINFSVYGTKSLSSSYALIDNGT
jgi:hypothetical protein